MLRAYGLKRLQFGPDYIIPKPFDPRVLTWESAAVAEAAVESGVARLPLENVEKYKERLEASLSRAQSFMSQIRHRARKSGRRIIFSDGEHDTIIRAVSRLQEEDYARPVLVGDPDVIRKRAEELGVKLCDAEIMNPKTYPERQELTEYFYDKRKRKGVTWPDAWYYSGRPDWFAALLLDLGRVDGMISGVSRSHPFVMRALLQTLPLRSGVRRAAGLFILLTKDDVYFLPDCTAQIEPSAEDLAETAILSAAAARYFHATPKVAMLSFSNFGSVQCEQTEKVRRAVEIIRRRAPDLTVDGEMQADTAVCEDLQARNFPFCELKGRANVLIFPTLASGNIAEKLVNRLGSAEVIGPLTLGLSKPINVLHPSCDVEDVVNATAITVIECLDGTL